MQCVLYWPVDHWTHYDEQCPEQWWLKHRINQWVEILGVDVQLVVLYSLVYAASLDWAGHWIDSSFLLRYWKTVLQWQEAWPMLMLTRWRMAA
jgi:hypothetical protein